MARFYAEIEGNRGSASRLGSADSGIRAHARGWDVGIAVYGDVVNGSDVFYVYVSGGSHDASARKLIATVREGSVELAR